MSIRDSFGVDARTVKEGLWLLYGDGEKIKISMVSPHNVAFQTEMARVQKVHRRQIELETLDDKEGQAILRYVYAKTIVLDWKGLTDKSGKEMVFSVENCVKLFEELPHLFTDIREQSQNLALFIEAQKAANAKNSQTS